MPNSSDALVRPSTDADIPAFARIYAHYVLHSAATFETEPPDSGELAGRRSEVLRRGLPWLTAEVDGSVAGYAYASPYRPRAAYRFTVEDSIYLAPEQTGKGLGKALLQELISACELACAREMIAVIGDSANTASVRLHEKFGFRHVGTLDGVGYKFERWVDTVLMQLTLGGR